MPTVNGLIFFPMCRITSEKTILKLRHIFNRFRVSNNGSAFTSAKFSGFCQENDIKHIRRPPFHTQSNVQVERFVNTFKSWKREGGTVTEILKTFLTSYRATSKTNIPHENSPAEALMNRKIQLHVNVIRLKWTKFSQEKHIYREGCQPRLNNLSSLWNTVIPCWT